MLLITDYTYQGVRCRMVLVVNFLLLKSFFFALLIAIFDLVHNVEAKFTLP